MSDHQNNSENNQKKGAQRLNLKNESGSKIEETFETVKNKSSKAQAAITKYLKSHPILSIGGIILAGAAIGAVLLK
jgi:ElaB/YqjD/DUF883 family membrane-anchored ribosome-binding protein